jgi:hypothetical protein
MEQTFRKRIRGIDKHLQFFLTDNENYYLGLLFEDYLKSPFLDKYGLPKQFPQNKSIIPNPNGSVTKANQKGCYVRMQPEEKETVIRHIDYVRKKDRVRVKYDREYNIYKKVLLHQFNTGLNFAVNEHGQKLVVSDILNYSSNDYLKGTHIANIFCEIFNDFEVFDKRLNPAIHFNAKFEQIILPSGKLDNQDNLDELIEIGKRFSKNEEAVKAYQKRLLLLKEYCPDIRGKGPNGFYGYIVFGFTDLNIVVLETMYAGNATYVFSTENFEQKVIMDKQTVINNKLHQARFFHHDNWESKIRKFMDDKLKKK